MGVWDEVLTIRPARVADGDTHWTTPVSWRFDGPRANGGGVRCRLQPMPGTEPM